MTSARSRARGGTRTIRRLAVVGRGESAMRTLSAVAELGTGDGAPAVSTLALHPESERGAWYTREADEAVALGPELLSGHAGGRSGTPRVDAGGVVDLLVAHAVDTVWIGSGLVDDRAEFTACCERAGLAVVGPSSATLRLIGDRPALRRVAAEARVPVLEHAAEPGRRLEVEVLGDDAGTIWVLSTRDSTLRRHGRPVLVESACPATPNQVREKVTAAAIRVAEAVGYRGAGIVEFFVSQSGRYHLTGVDVEQEAGHALTEEVTGLDLVALRLALAAGARLEGTAPESDGHAIEARLYAGDGGRGAGSARGGVALIVLPARSGVRVDTGLTEGDLLGEGSEELLATVTAWGRDRVQALARLRQALDRMRIVIRAGTAGRGLLLAALDREEFAAGDVDDAWLEALVAGGALGAPDAPLALVAAAVEAYDSDEARARSAFLDGAARGRPGRPEAVGADIRLRYGDTHYSLRVAKVGPGAYEVRSFSHDVPVAVRVDVERVGPIERRLACAGRRHRVVTVSDGPACRVELGGHTHTVTREDSFAIRAGWPAIVVSLLVEAGEEVTAGQPVAVLEAMKMESVVTSPVDGEVTGIEVVPNAQVGPETVLMGVRVPAGDPVQAAPGPDAVAPLDLSALATGDDPAGHEGERAYAALHAYLLGYDLDPATLKEALTLQKALAVAETDPALIAREEAFLDLYADCAALDQPVGRTPDGPVPPPGPREYLDAYLQWLDPDRACLPDGYRQRLERVLVHHAVTGPHRTVDVESAVFRLARSVERVHELAGAVAAVLGRRRDHDAGLARPGGPDTPRDALLRDAVRERTRTKPSGNAAGQPLDEYGQKVLRAKRFGAPYPYEIVKMLAGGTAGSRVFPEGSFTEYDLGTGGGLVAVDREPGGNSAHVVVGLMTNVTRKVPEGMTRVMIMSDQTKGLGNLAEPECARINAALDLAERLAVPVEWFAVSSGALISMDSGTENMDWISATLRRIIEFTQAGGEINIIVTGITVGGQPYWNAEATMLMHTKGILVMTPNSTMVLTGKQALDFSGGVSADDNFGIGGFDHVMGPNGQAQYWADSFDEACELLLAHYEHTYVVPGELFPRRRATCDPVDRDVRDAPHAAVPGCCFTRVGDVFEANPDRKMPFDMRSVMRAVADADTEPLERWRRWRGADTSIVWDAHVGGIPVCMLGLESRTIPRLGFVPGDGPSQWTSGTLFPQSSRKTARAINAASGNRPLVVLANLSGFDGSPESMRHWQLEYGAEIGRAVTNFHGPIVFVVVSRYHGGAFVVFSKALNPSLEIAAVEGSYASVIGGAPAAATVFAREVKVRTEKDQRVVRLRDELAGATGPLAAGAEAALRQVAERVRSEKLGEVAAEFDSVHTIERALKVGSVDRIIDACRIRPYVIDALERGLERAHRPRE
jgi:acetyl/propionyl-CoA carboxylase alpha subunit/acetyl-CoA carboxylase carboxyltransferase component